MESTTDNLQAALTQQERDTRENKQRLSALSGEIEQAKQRLDTLRDDWSKASAASRQSDLENKKRVAELAHPWVLLRQGNDWDKEYLEADSGTDYHADSIERSLRPKCNPVRVRDTLTGSERLVSWVALRSVGDGGSESVVPKMVDGTATRPFDGLWVHSDEWESGMPVLD